MVTSMHLPYLHQATHTKILVKFSNTQKLEGNVSNPVVDPGPPLFLNQTEAQKAEKNFLEITPPPLPYWPPPTIIWRSGSATEIPPKIQKKTLQPSPSFGIWSTPLSIHKWFPHWGTFKGMMSNPVIPAQVPEPTVQTFFAEITAWNVKRIIFNFFFFRIWELGIWYLGFKILDITGNVMWKINQYYRIG